MSLKHYYSKLSETAQAEVNELRKFDSSGALKLSALKEDLDAEIITHKGFNDAVSAIDSERKAIKSRYTAEFDKLKKEFDDFIDKYMAPSTGFLNCGDMEILKNFKLSSVELEAMAEKYADNPTMLRLIDDHRVEHGIQTNWRMQSGEDRKKVFLMTSFGVQHSIDPKYVHDPESQISALISEGYHKHQGSNSSEFTIEQAPEPLHKPTII